MISAEQKPACPVCRKTDKVLKLQTAYNHGVMRLEPPAVHRQAVGMARLVGVGMLLVGLCIFFIIILVGSESFGQGISVPEIILVSLTIICIVLALSLSFVAFTRIVRGDRAEEKLYAGWDHAMENYNRLRYCARDDVVFDPQTGKSLSGDALAALLSVESPQEQQKTAATLTPS